MSKGIDYGMGRTNIDTKTGIRFGVINSGEVCQAWCDSSEGDYGEPACPKCGNEVTEYDDDKHGEYDQYSHEGCCDYACEDCEHIIESSDALGDEAIGFTLDDGEYKATQSGDDSDIFILASPYYTRAQFCSPCAPGAGYLMNPCDDGPKTYCFGHDWFDDGKAPYPVYSVDDDTLVEPK